MAVSDHDSDRDLLDHMAEVDLFDSFYRENKKNDQQAGNRTGYHGSKASIGTWGTVICILIIAFLIFSCAVS